MVTGITFDKQLLTSRQHAHFYNLFLNHTDGVTKGCEITRTDSNVYIGKGFFVACGRFVEITGTEAIEMPTVVSGQLYCRVVFTIDLSLENTETEFRQGYFETLTSANSYPGLTQDDLDDDGTVYQMPFAQYIKTPSSVSSFVDQRPIYDMESVWATIADNNEEFQKEFEDFYDEKKEEVYALIDTLKDAGFLPVATYDPEGGAKQVAFKEDVEADIDAVKSSLTNGSVTKIGTVNVGTTTRPIYLNEGTPTALTSTVGGSATPMYMNNGTMTALSSTVGSGTKPIYSNGGTLTAFSTTVGGTAQPVYVSSGALTALSATVGSGTKPVYLSSGTITVSSSTVGSGTKPVYLSSGTITVSGSTVGSSTQPMWLNSGTMTACSSTVGSGTKPIYSASGVLTASSSTVGSGTKPIYMSSGTLTASSSTVGSSTTPVYLSSGTITACSAMMPLSGSTFTGQAYAYNNTNYTTYQLRNAAFSTTVPSDLPNGAICFMYE